MSGAPHNIRHPAFCPCRGQKSRSRGMTPEEMAEIASLPPSQQNEALRAAMPDPLEQADRLRDEAKYADLEDDGDA